jgi:DNA-directed RNA polymerase specialized sigma24 family protein
VGDGAATGSGADVLRPDERGFDAFVSSHGSRLLRTAWLLTGDRGAAEDLLREVLVRVWGRWPRVAGADEPLSVVRRQVLSTWVSRRSPEGPGRGDGADTGPGAGPGVDVLGPDLSARQRAVLVLTAYEDLPDAQAAEALAVSTDVVRSQRAKALQAEHGRLGADAAEVEVESLLRTRLAAAAETVAPWAVPGAELRRTADRRRARRRRAVVAATATVALAAAAGSVLSGPPGPSPGPDPAPTPSVVDFPDDRLEPEESWTDVPLTGEMRRRAVTAAMGGSDMDVLVSTRLPGSEQVLVVLRDAEADGPARVVTVTFDSDEPGARARRGTGATYPSAGSLVAQPARDGDGTVLVVLVPSAVGDTVQASSSVPGRPVLRTSAFLRDRLAVVPVTAPEAVTRLRLLRRGEPRLDTVPAGWQLGRDVPRTLERVVASTGEPLARPVQVRTDGGTACRVTVGGWWPQGRAYADWNPVDPACTPVDGRLRLLLPLDRRHGAVAGIAPPGARSVRLGWAGGPVTEVPTAGGDVNAFLGPLDRRADQLVRAEAVSDAGQVIATASP